MTSQRPPEPPSDDDALFAEMFKHANVQHRPGMAAELMEELAPLLRADGIDLDDPQASFTIDELNAAMQRATDQHNLSLFTPVGAQRQQVMHIILQAVEAYNVRGQQGLVDALAPVRPEPTDITPAHSHIIGASLSMLDEWLTNPALADTLVRVRVPKWKGAARKAATDVLGLARAGRSYDALGSLIAHRGGAVIEQAAVLVVAATLRALADASGSTLRETFTAMLDQGDDALQPHTATNMSGSAFGLNRDADVEDDIDQIYLEEFTDWLLRGAPNADPSDVEDEISLIRTLVGVATGDDMNFHDLDDFEQIVHIVSSFDEEAVVRDTLRTLHDYAYFRYRTDMFGDDWHDVLALIEDRQAAVLTPPQWVLELLEESNEPGADTWKAVSALPAVRGAKKLLDWIGASKPVTSTGRLRRADIEPVAAMIGVAARGVAKLPPVGSLDPESRVYVVQSMNDVPPLEAWWEALIAAGIVELTRSRVRPGESAAAFLDEAGFDSLEDGGESAMHVIVSTIAAVLVPPSPDFLHSGISFTAAQHSVTMLLNALAPEGEHLPLDPGPNDLYAAVVMGMSKRQLRMLAEFGVVELVEPDAADHPLVYVDEALRGVVARGVFQALQFLDAHMHDSMDDE